MNDKLGGYVSFITEVDKAANQWPSKCHYINYESDFDIYFPGVRRRRLSSAAALSLRSAYTGG